VRAHNRRINLELGVKEGTSEEVTLELRSEQRKEKLDVRIGGSILEVGNEIFNNLVIKKRSTTCLRSRA
jgi:hypothetical protein